LEFKGKVIIDFLDKKLKGDNKMKLQIVKEEDFEIAMNMINVAKQHLKEQGIDQWQNGYPDEACIHNDIINKRGYFLSDENQELGYLCIDFDGEPAYEKLDGKWLSDGKYVVVHRLALS
jgi:acetyltransferase